MMQAQVASEDKPQLGVYVGVRYDDTTEKSQNRATPRSHLVNRDRDSSVWFDFVTSIRDF